MQLAKDNDYWDLDLSNVDRVIRCENRAMDSYHNILYSITAFFHEFHTWPRSIVIVGHGFKKPRIVDGHCNAIDFPLSRVAYVGIDPPAMTVANAENPGMQGVVEALGDWKEDPHGRGEKLAAKRRQRNVHNVWQGVFVAEASDKGGLLTEGAGDDEHLLDGAPRPWTRV